MKKNKNNKQSQFYDEFDEMLKQCGGIIFICRTNQKTMAGVIRDEKKQSPIFEFCINNPAGLSTMFECEKALADQNIAYYTKNGFWLGEAVTNTELQYLSSTYGAKSAPAAQKELIERVNQTIDRCTEYMRQSIEKEKRIHISASQRMNYYIQNTDFGEYIQNRYPQLFGTYTGESEKEMI